MKHLSKQTIFFVLLLHIVILLLIWGGLSCLGVAVCLAVPAVSTLVFIAYHEGQSSMENRQIRNQKIQELSPNVLHWRG